MQVSSRAVVRETRRGGGGGGERRTHVSVSSLSPSLFLKEGRERMGESLLFKSFVHQLPHTKSTTGEGPPQIVMATTLCGTPGHVTDLCFSSIMSSSMTYTWTQPAVVNGDPAMLEYEVSVVYICHSSLFPSLPPSLFSFSSLSLLCPPPLSPLISSSLQNSHFLFLPSSRHTVSATMRVA